MAETIAIIGASRDRRKFGNMAVRAYLRKGFTVYPVHPRETEIEGQPAFADLAAVPGDLDRVALYVPPAIGITLLEKIAARHPAKLYINPGTGSPELLAKARALGLDPLETCAIRAIGMNPAQLVETPGNEREPGSAR
jgi:predicted CoA-binding protein